MKVELRNIIEAERKVKADINAAVVEKTKIIEAAILSGTEAANQIYAETDAKVQAKIEEKRLTIAKLNEQLQNVVKLENDKIVKQVSDRIKQVTEQIYKEAIRND